MRLGSLWSFVKQVVTGFLAESPFQLAGALSFYTLLSLSPLVLVIVGGAGLVWRREAVRQELLTQIEQLVGPAGAQTVRLVLDNAGSLGQDAVSITVGIVMLLVGATTVLGQLQTSLNHMWNVRVTSSQRVVWSLVRARLLSMAILLAVGFLLLVSLVLSATLAALHHYLSQVLPGGGLLWNALNLVASLLVITLLIATIFKVLPDARIEWHDIWVGAFSTSALFGIGKFLIGLYLGRASIGSAYGAAGSLVVFLLWVYYSSLILFLGAEITQVYARRRGARIRPAEYAVLVDAP